MDAKLEYYRKNKMVKRILWVDFIRKTGLINFATAKDEISLIP